MPKVRILSGNQTGAVIEMSQPEAESAVDFGTGELVVASAQLAPKVEPAPPKTPKKR